ncbi:MAG: phosphate signaling complex protein PhoU [Clostridia bacterium]|nr:phosphate signaling complex protein PhoU [Clostridia bacterium]
MRSRFDEQLSTLREYVTEMGALCEKIIAFSAEALKENDGEIKGQVRSIGQEIDRMEGQIEAFCLKLLLRQQPVARDLRQISAALKLITDLERIGDQAEDIAEILPYLKGRRGKECETVCRMMDAAAKMVNDSVTAYVKQDVALARCVEEYDDVVDDLFDEVKEKLILLISQNADDGEYALDLLMIAKYLERIGDHATNVSEWVVFSVTGVHETEEQ